MYTYPIQSSPRQPDNPTNLDRDRLSYFALAAKGRADDFPYIKSLMSPPPDITSVTPAGSLKGCKVGIVGGGLAGLAAAFELKKLGCEITVFEALKSRIGGRVYTYYFDNSNKLYGEFGPMRIPVTHETTWHYINLFKLNTYPFKQVNDNALIDLKDTRVQNDPQGLNVMRYIYPKYHLTAWERSYKWQDLLYYGIESQMLSVPPQIRCELLQVKPTYSDPILSWDASSNRQMLESKSLSQGAINMLSNLSPLMGQNLYNGYIDLTQANYSVNLSYLYSIKDGTVNLPLAFSHALLDNHLFKKYTGVQEAHAGKVCLKQGTQVTGIHQCNEKRVDVLYREMHQNQSESFDYLVCALPFSTLRTVEIKPLFTSRKMQAIKEVNYIPAAKTLMLFAQRFWERGGPAKLIIGGGSYTDLPLTSIWYPPAALTPSGNNLTGTGNPNVPGVLIASYAYTLDSTRLSNLPEQDRIRVILRELEKVHGLPLSSLDALLLDYKTVYWDSEPWCRGALTFFTPQQKKLFSFAMTEPEFENRVFFAGDHISAVHRWMQGALQSGMIAANCLATSHCTK